MKKYVLLILTLLLFSALVGCNPDPIPSMATVSGYVTFTTGGPVLPKALVTGKGFSVLTDEEGYFEVGVQADEQFDLFVEKDGYSKARVQDICLAKDEDLELEIPIREVFHPDWSTVPPRLIIEGVERGDVVKGDLEIDITVDGDRDAYLLYVYFCASTRTPVEFVEVGANEGTGTIDTTLFPNGKGFVRVIAYDENENAVIAIIPVIIDNDLAASNELPEDLDSIILSSTTFGMTVGFYSKQRAEIFSRMGFQEDPYLFELHDGSELDLRVVPSNTTVYNTITWVPVENATGYNVYRSLDGVNYKWIATQTQVGQYGTCSADDFSPVLTPGEAIYYRVVPYNGKGESTGAEYPITPLLPFNLMLLEPADGAVDVPLRPTFKWETTFPHGPIDESVTITYGNWIWEGTNENILWDITENDEQFTLGFDLEPGTVYTWDIASAWAWTYFESEEGSSAYAMVYAGKGPGINDGGGSMNGEFTFTTTLEPDCG